MINNNVNLWIEFIKLKKARKDGSLVRTSD